MIIAVYFLGGLNHCTCKALSSQISLAVDFQKTGIPADSQMLSTGPALQIRAKPHSLRPLDSKPFSDCYGKFYHSKNLLGQIYDLARGFIKDLPKPDNKLDSVVRETMQGSIHTSEEFDDAALKQTLLTEDWNSFMDEFGGQMKARKCNAPDIFIPSHRYNGIVKDLVERRKNTILAVLLQHKQVLDTEGTLRLGPNVTHDHAMKFMKYLLFTAWQFAVTKYGPTVGPDLMEIGMGYAAIWLYLWHDWLLPV